MIILGFYGPETTATLVDGTDNVYEFSGIVKAWDKSGNASENVVLSCTTNSVVRVTITDYP